MKINTTPSASVNMSPSASVKMLCLVVFIFMSGFFQQPSAQHGRNKVQRVRLARGESSTVLRGRLRPYANHVYRLHAREGQKMTVRVESPADDVVFWVKTRMSGREKHWLILEGVHRNGQTEWSGALPASGEYEIQISNPPVSDHPVRRALSYQVKLEIE